MVCCSLFFSFLFLGLTCLLQLEFLRESYAVYTPLRWCTYMYIIIKCRGHILLIAVRHSHKHTCITKRQSAALIIVLPERKCFYFAPHKDKKKKGELINSDCAVISLQWQRSSVSVDSAWFRVSDCRPLLPLRLQVRCSAPWRHLDLHP